MVNAAAMRALPPWERLTTPMRRAVRRLALFEDVIPADAVVALARLGRADLAKLVATGALVGVAGGFRLEPSVRVIGSAEEEPEALRAQARWFDETIRTLVAGDLATAFERIEQMMPDVRAAITRLSRHPDLAVEAAALWCAIADALFYRRLLPFDAPEYVAAVTWADHGDDVALRVAARIVAGRATMEVKPKDAAALFEDARTLARAAGLEDLDADAARGLGWYHLAHGGATEAETLFDEARRIHERMQNARGIADACMANAVARALRGERDDADRLLFRAEALLRARRDSVRVAKLLHLRSMLGFDAGGASSITAEEYLARGQYWRAALALSRSGDPRAEDKARVLAELAGIDPDRFVRSLEDPTAPPDPSPRRSWRLRSDGPRRLLVSPEGASTDLSRRGPLVRMIEAFARKPGAQSTLELFEAAWPGETARHESALYRVYTTVRRLRALGVPVATSADGYACGEIELDA